MKRILMAAAGFAVLSITACKKDKAEPNTGNRETTKLVKKVTKTENGQVTVYNFTYDAGKRLISYKAADNSEFIDFSYDPAGNLVKVEQSDADFKNIYSYAYNNNIPVSGVFKSWENENGNPGNLVEDDKLSYTVTNNQVTKIHLEMTLAGEVADFNLTYANGNLSKVTMPDPSLYTATFTFGNKKPVYPMVSKYILDQAGFSLQFAAKNEMLTAAFDFPGTQLDNTITAHYTYDVNGYVLTSTDGTAQLKFDYE